SHQRRAILECTRLREDLLDGCGTLFGVPDAVLRFDGRDLAFECAHALGARRVLWKRSTAKQRVGVGARSEIAEVLHRIDRLLDPVAWNHAHSSNECADFVLSPVEAEVPTLDELLG